MVSSLDIVIFLLMVLSAITAIVMTVRYLGAKEEIDHLHALVEFYRNQSQARRSRADEEAMQFLAEWERNDS